MTPANALDSAVFSHRFADVNGVRLHYVVGGQGPPLLLWHGFLETWYCWRKIMPVLAEQFTVLAPDMRGYGDSDQPTAGYDARTLAEDFRALVKSLGFGRIILVGHDMGAPPALVYAGEYPAEVRGVVYLDEPVLLQKNVEQLLKFAPATMQGGGLWWWSFALTGDLPETLLAGHERAFLTHNYDQFLCDRASIDEATTAEYLRSFAAPGGVRGAFGVYRAVFDSIKQTEPYASTKITVPVLALGGEKSMGSKPLEMMRGVVEHVQGGSVPHCGHFIADERPDYLVAQIRDFAGSLPA